jgi:endonuclease IV
MYGHHVNKGDSYAESLQAAYKQAAKFGIKLQTAQIFVMGPRNRHINIDAIAATNIAKFVDDTRQKHPFNLFVHATYLDNLWGKANGVPHFVRQQLKLCDDIHAAGFVLHIANKAPQEIAAAIPQLLKDAPATPLFLEIDSYAPETNSYESHANLLALRKELERVDESKQDDTSILDRVGICIDTAHLWAGGVNLSTYDAAADWIKKYEDIGFKLTMIHLNDQIWGLGRGKDEHAPLAYGIMWEMYRDSPRLSGLAAFVDYAARGDVPVVLERKEDKPKPNGLPKGSNVDSDYMILAALGVK